MISPGASTWHPLGLLKAAMWQTTLNVRLEPSLTRVTTSCNVSVRTWQVYMWPPTRWHRAVFFSLTTSWLETTVWNDPSKPWAAGTRSKMLPYFDTTSSRLLEQCVCFLWVFFLSETKFLEIVTRDGVCIIQKVFTWNCEVVANGSQSIEIRCPRAILLTCSHVVAVPSPPSICHPKNANETHWTHQTHGHDWKMHNLWNKKISRGAKLKWKTEVNLPTWNHKIAAVKMKSVNQSKPWCE